MKSITISLAAIIILLYYLLLPLFSLSLLILSNVNAKEDNVAEVKFPYSNYYDDENNITSNDIIIKSLEMKLQENMYCKECYDKLSEAYSERKEYAKAAEVYHRALKLAPSSIELRMNYGNALQTASDDLGTYEQTKIVLESPKCDGLYHPVNELKANLGIHAHACISALSKALHYSQMYANITFFQHHFHILLNIANAVASDKSILPKGAYPIIHPHMALRLPIDGKMQLELIQRFAKKAAEDSLMLEINGFMPPRPPSFGLEEKLRIGYVATTFDSDAVVTFLLRDIFGKHNKKLFEVYSYQISSSSSSSNQAASNDINNQAKRNMSDVKVFRDLSSMKVEDMIVTIRKDEIHILIDLQGHIRGGKMAIFAARSAPIQISYLGFIGTTGADYFDYVITDAVASPPKFSDKASYTEKLIRMPHSFFVGSHFLYYPKFRKVLGELNDTKEDKNDDDGGDYKDIDPKVLYSHHRQLLGIEKDEFIFGCFNNAYKMDKTVLDMWVSILKETKKKGIKSRIWLLDKPIGVKKYLEEYFANNGIDVKNQLIFTDIVPIGNYIAHASQVDLGLDTIWYSGGATTADFLFAGVPVLTMGKGTTMVSRMTRSMNLVVGLETLVVSSTKEYIEMAVTVASDKEFYNSIRSKFLFQRVTSPLFDTGKWVCNLEKGLLEAWDMWVFDGKRNGIWLDGAGC